MKITGVTITPIAFRDPPLLNSVGVHQPWALRSIVEITTDEGIYGLGESYGDVNRLGLYHQAAAALPGLDVFDINGLRHRIARAVGIIDSPDAHGLTGPSSEEKTLNQIVATFEVALLDIQGKAINQPVHALLGGKVRDRVPFSAYLFYKWAAHPGADPDEWGAALDPDGIVAQARRMINQHGFESIKLKGGVFSPDDEVAAIQALRDAFPDSPLRLDPNAVWSVETSVRVAEKTDGLLEYLEDPTRGIPAMAEVAAKAPMPLATNMCVISFGDIPESVRLGAVGVILSDHHYWGGLRASQRLAGICDTFGMGLSMHSNSHLGVSLAAMVHLAAASPTLSYACDTHLPWVDNADNDVIVGGQWAFEGGAVTVPDTPGLGVELDRDALARMHEQYLRTDIRVRDDTGYMRTFEPDFDPTHPDW